MSAESITEKSRKQRVFWNSDERRKVIYAAVPVYLEDDSNLWRHMNEAQRQVLPPARQRLITSSLIATDEDKVMFRAALEEFLTKRYQVVLEPAPAAEPELTPTPASKPESQDVEPVQPTIDRSAIIETLTNEELFDLLARRLAPILNGFGVLIKILKTQLFSPVTSPAPTKEAPAPSPTPVAVPPALQPTQFVATSTQPAAQVATRPTPPPAPPALPPTPKLRKVVIFGFPNEIESLVKRKAGSFNLELLFVSHEPGEGAPKIPACDWCIFNDNIKTTRRMDTALRARPGLHRLHRVGTADKVMKKLADINSL